MLFVESLPLSASGKILKFKLRKELADAEGAPLYNLFTNEQMAEMVTRRVTSAAQLRQIPGVGEARVDKYGAAFLACLADALAKPAPPSASAESDAAQSPAA